MVTTTKKRYAPSWDDVEAWTLRFIRANVWRVRPLLDEEDLHQEALAKFWELSTRYEFETEGHFGTMYRGAMNRHVIDATRGRRRWEPKTQASLDSCEEPTALSVRDRALDEVELRLDVADAPEPVRAFVEGILDGQSATLIRGETYADRVCRITGLAPDMSDVESLFDVEGARKRRKEELRHAAQNGAEAWANRVLSV